MQSETRRVARSNFGRQQKSYKETWAITQNNYNLENGRSSPLPTTANLYKPSTHVSYGSFLPHFDVNTESLTRILLRLSTRGISETSTVTPDTGNDVVCTSPPLLSLIQFQKLRQNNLDAHSLAHSKTTQAVVAKSLALSRWVARTLLNHQSPEVPF